MRIIRSFLLRLSEIVAASFGLCFVVMAITLGLQLKSDGIGLFIGLSILCLLWIVVANYLVRKTDPELVKEVARWLYPGGGLVSVAISFICMIWLDALIENPGGREHLTVIFVGLGILGFLIVRCFDIKWLREEDEILGRGMD